MEKYPGKGDKGNTIDKRIYVPAFMDLCSHFLDLSSYIVLFSSVSLYPFSMTGIWQQQWQSLCPCHAPPTTVPLHRLVPLSGTLFPCRTHCPSDYSSRFILSGKYSPDGSYCFIASLPFIHNTCHGAACMTFISESSIFGISYVYFCSPLCFPIEHIVWSQ